MLKMQSTALATLAIVGLVCAAGQPAKSETLSAEPVTLTVENGFTLARSAPMAFGIFAVTADTAGSNTATLTMDPSTGSLTPGNSAPAAFTSINTTAASRGIYTVTGAAPNTGMNVSTANLTNLTCGACSTSPNAITLTSVTADDSTPTTDGSGDATINLGAVLTTVSGGNQYEDGAYAGSFDVIVNY